MRRSIRTAIIAAAETDVRRRMPSLMAAAGLDLVAAAEDGASAWLSASEHRPDLLIADACLPVMDGSSLVKRICCDAPLPVQPELMILYRPEFPVPDRAKLERMGVAFLPWPADRDAFCAAVEAVRGTYPVFPEHRMQRICRLMDALGVPQHPGRQCIALAVLLCADNERLQHGRGRRLYPMLGEMLGIAPDGVERRMRYAIGAAWQSDQFENQYRIFADTVDARRGQPTCGEMIARLADILRLEG